MKNYIVHLIALLSLVCGFSAKAEYSITTLTPGAKPPYEQQYSITNIQYFVIDDRGLYLSGKLVSEDVTWYTLITKKALEDAGVSAAEFLNILKENESTGRNSLNVVYDVPHQQLTIVQY